MSRSRPQAIASWSLNSALPDSMLREAPAYGYASAKDEPLLRRQSAAVAGERFAPIEIRRYAQRLVAGCPLPPKRGHLSVSRFADLLFMWAVSEWPTSARNK